MIFPAAPLGRPTKVITAVVSVFAGIGVPALTLALPGQPTVARASGLLGPVIVAVAWAMAPAAFEVAAGDVRVLRRAWRPYVVPSARLLDLPDPERAGLRALGNGGLFGWYGRYHRRDIGTYRLYATTLANAFLVPLRGSGGEVVVVSPADATGFRAAVDGASR